MITTEVKYNECLGWALKRFNNDCDVDITTNEFEKVFDWFMFNMVDIEKIIKNNN